MAAAPSRGLVGLLKRGWHEIPDIVGSGIMALGGVGIGLAGLYYYYNVIDGDNRRYKQEYTVIRHDDPKAKKVRKDYLGDE